MGASTRKNAPGNEEPKLTLPCFAVSDLLDHSSNKPSGILSEDEDERGMAVLKS